MSVQIRQNADELVRDSTTAITVQMTFADARIDKTIGKHMLLGIKALKSVRHIYKNDAIVFTGL